MISYKLSLVEPVQIWAASSFCTFNLCSQAELNGVPEAQSLGVKTLEDYARETTTYTFQKRRNTMKLDQLEISISKMSEDELRDFILENRRAQSRYKETMAIAKPKRVTVSSAGVKTKEEMLQQTLQSIDPDVLKKILKDKGIL